MTPRQKAIRASSPAIGFLMLGLAWWMLDPKGDARRHLLDRAVRLLDRVA